MKSRGHTGSPTPLARVSRGSVGVCGGPASYVVAANQGASLAQYPPYSWPGGSEIIDYDGRGLARATPGPGERIVVAPIDITALRHERATRRGHHMLAHLRTEAYPIYAKHVYPPAGEAYAACKGLSYELNNLRIDAAKHQGEGSIVIGAHTDSGQAPC